MKPEIWIVNSSKKHCGVDDYCLFLEELFGGEARFRHFAAAGSDFAAMLAKRGSAAATLPDGYLAARRLFKRAVRAERPALVHIQTARDYHLATAVPRDGGTRVLVTRHNSFPLARFPNGRFLRRAELVIALSEFSRGVLTGSFPRRPPRTALVFNSIRDPGTGAPRPDTRNAGLTLGFLGRLTRQKGLHLLLEALAGDAVAAAPRPVRLVVAGGYDDDGYRREIDGLVARHALAPRVDFAGFLADKDAFFAGIDALVVPSLLSWRETCPLVVFEALARRVPVLCFPSGSLPELVADGEAGLVCGQESAEELSKLIARLAGEPGLAARLGEGARRRFEERYSPELFRRRMRELYFSPGADA